MAKTGFLAVPTHFILDGFHPFYLELREPGQAHGVFLRNGNGMDILLGSSSLTYRSIGGMYLTHHSHLQPPHTTPTLTLTPSSFQSYLSSPHTLTSPILTLTPFSSHLIPPSPRTHPTLIPHSSHPHPTLPPHPILTHPPPLQASSTSTSSWAPNQRQSSSSTRRSLAGHTCHREPPLTHWALNGVVEWLIIILVMSNYVRL